MFGSLDSSTGLTQLNVSVTESDAAQDIARHMCDNGYQGSSMAPIVQCNRVGRYVTVSVNKNTTLHLCEVHVYGKKPCSEVTESKEHIEFSQGKEKEAINACDRISQCVGTTKTPEGKFTLSCGPPRPSQHSQFQEKKMSKFGTRKDLYKEIMSSTQVEVHRHTFSLKDTGVLMHEESGLCLQPASSQAQGGPVHLVMGEGCSSQEVKFQQTIQGNLKHLASGKCVHV